LNLRHITVKTNPFFRYEDKIGKERNLVIFKDTPIIIISMESSRRDLFIDMAVDRFIFKIKQISPCFTFTPKTGMALPKIGVSCAHS